MTRYTNVKLNISEGQKEKLQHATKAGCSAVSIRLVRKDLEGDDILAVTNSQVKKLAKDLENGKGITIRTRAITKRDHTPQQLLVKNRLMSQECKISHNKSGKLSQNMPVLPQVITIQEIS